MTARPEFTLFYMITIRVRTVFAKPIWLKITRHLLSMTLCAGNGGILLFNIRHWLILSRRIAENITFTERTEAVHRLEMYRSWFLNEILCVYSSNSLLILPISEVKPDYRDAAPVTHEYSRKIPLNIFDNQCLSPILGAPEIVLPSM